MATKKFTLEGVDGNSFAIINHVSKCMIKACLAHLVGEYKEKAMEGNYSNLLSVSQDYINKCNQIFEDND